MAKRRIRLLSNIFDITLAKSAKPKTRVSRVGTAGDASLQFLLRQTTHSTLNRSIDVNSTGDFEILDFSKIY